MWLRGNAGSSGRYQHFSDEALVALMSRDDIGALDAFYDRVGHLAYGLALRIVGDEKTAQDLVCAAFATLWQRAPAYNWGGARVQLLALTHRSACDAVRQRRTPTPFAEANGDLSPWITLERESAEEVLALLGEDERAVIELVYYAGRSRSQVGEQLGVPIETISGRLTSGMNTLRRHNGASASVLGEAPLDAGESTPTPN